MGYKILPDAQDGRIQQLQASLNESEKQIESLSHQLSTAEGKLKNVSSQHQLELSDLTKDKSAEVDEQRSQYERILHSKREEISRLVNENSNVTQQRDDLASKNTNFVREIDFLRKSLASEQKNSHIVLPMTQSVGSQTSELTLAVGDRRISSPCSSVTVGKWVVGV